jgi:hypothetical protein
MRSKEIYSFQNSGYRLLTGLQTLQLDGSGGQRTAIVGHTAFQVLMYLTQQGSYEPSLPRFYINGSFLRVNARRQ